MRKKPLKSSWPNQKETFSRLLESRCKTGQQVPSNKFIIIAIRQRQKIQWANGTELEEIESNSAVIKWKIKIFQFNHRQ